MRGERRERQRHYEKRQRVAEKSPSYEFVFRNFRILPMFSISLPDSNSNSARENKFRIIFRAHGKGQKSDDDTRVSNAQSCAGLVVPQDQCGPKNQNQTS